MLAVKHLMPAGATVDDAHRIMQMPEVVEKLSQVAPGAKSSTKTRMKAVWGPEIAEIFLPSTFRTGRPKGPAAARSIWAKITRVVLTKMAEKLEVDLPLPEDAAFWTPETTSLAADAIFEHYTNVHSATTMATQFRNALKTFGVATEALNATKRSEVTTIHNAKIAVRQEERQEVGINTPTPFKNIADLKSRAETFISQPTTVRPTSQDAADFLVIFSARPGEAQSLVPGPTGGVIGALKKRHLDADEYPVASAVGTELALRFLASWRARDANAVKAAMNALTQRVKIWGITRPDLRAIGAELAVRAAAESGKADNEGKKNTIREIALRHGAPHPLELNPVAVPEEFKDLEVKIPAPVKAKSEPSKSPIKGARKTATEHYTRVNDPSIAIAAKLANASPKMQAAIAALLAASEADQTMLCSLISKMGLGNAPAK